MLDGVTAVAAILAALAAIIAPVITSLIDYKKSVHLKKIEIFESAVQSSITDLTKSFAELEKNYEYSQFYVQFLSAAYTVSARINDELVQKNSMSCCICCAAKMGMSIKRSQNALIRFLA